MTIEQFAKSLLEPKNPSPLLQALDALRSCDLDQLRNPEQLSFNGWIPWGEDTPAQNPQSYVKRPELRS